MADELAVVDDAVAHEVIVLVDAIVGEVKRAVIVSAEGLVVEGPMLIDTGKEPPKLSDGLELVVLEDDSRVSAGWTRDLKGVFVEPPEVPDADLLPLAQAIRELPVDKRQRLTELLVLAQPAAAEAVAVDAAELRR